MGLFKRLSDSVWSYVSPRRTTGLPTPKTDEQIFKKPALPTGRRASIHELSKHAKSMSPDERVGNWRIRSPVSSAGIKRKRSFESPTLGRKRKMSRMDIDEEDSSAIDGLMEDDYDTQNEFTEEDAGQQYDEFTRGYTGQEHSSSPQIGRTDTPLLDDYEDDSDAMSVDTSIVVGEEEYTPPSRKVVDLPEEHSMRHISSDELRSQGWDDDYITLIQKIAMRGYEPVLPAYMKFEYRFLPDGLFEQNDDAFISSVRGDHFKASKALERLVELGGRVRDRILLESRIQPEKQVKRQINSYLRWAIEDAGLDTRTMIPILAIESRPAGTEASLLRANATAKCRSLARQYREALRVKRSIEVSPASDGTIISYPLPTFYAIIASHAIVAIMAYKPDEEGAEVTPMAFFDFKDKDYDVWNSLALAIVLCHVRNVQLRIAEETGLGERQSVYSDSGVDPDL